MLRKIKYQLPIFFILPLLFFSCSRWKVQKTSPSVSKNDFPHFDVHKKILPNGLTLLFVQRNKVPVFSFYNFVKIGSHYETPGITGSAHFLEHLMFLGGEKYGAGEFDKVMASHGGSSNASTDYDVTIYHENLPISALDKILDMEGDRLRNLALDPQAFEKERNVILEERKMRLENSPQGQIMNRTLSELFANTPYKEAIIGKEEDIKNVSREEIRGFFEQYYAPNNMVMVVVGDFSPSVIFEKLEKNFASLKKNDNLDKNKKGMDDLSLYNIELKENKKISIHGNSKNPIFFMAMESFPSGNKKGVLMELLANLMGYGRSSFLNQNYVNNERPLLSYVHAMNYSLNNAGVFAITGQLIEGKTSQQIDSLEKDLNIKLGEFCEQVITPRNVTKTKNQFLVYYFEGLQKTSEIASVIGKYEASYGDYSAYLKEIEIINTASVEELKTVCQEMLVNKKKLFISLWDQHPKDGKSKGKK